MDPLQTNLPVHPHHRARGGQDRPRGNLHRVRLPVPGKPSLAVLPFDNFGGDAEQEYFSDRLTEKLITRKPNGKKIRLMDCWAWPGGEKWGRFRRAVA
ncbi:MAG: hypothetical protein V3S29_05705 [bacterium]